MCKVSIHKIYKEFAPNWFLYLIMSIFNNSAKIQLNINQKCTDAWYGAKHHICICTPSYVYTCPTVKYGLQ